MKYTTLSRSELQSLAKKHGIKANLKSQEIIELLISNAALTQEDATNTNNKNKHTVLDINNDVRLQDQKRLNQPFSIDDQVSSDDLTSDHTGSRINDYYNVDLVSIERNNKENNINKKNKNKFIKPTYKQSILQRIKENPPVRSNSFQGIDYWVNRCIISIPDNPTGIKLRGLLSFEIEKITIDIPDELQSEYNKQKITVRYDCEDHILLNLISEQYNNNPKSIWKIEYDPNTFSLISSIKENVTKLSFKQLNQMYKRSNKYFESINHDVLYSLIGYLIQDSGEYVKILKSPLLIAFNILQSLDDSYYEFIKQIRVDTLHADLMSCISLQLDPLENRIIMIPDLNIFNGIINTSWDYNTCVEQDHKRIQDIIITRSTGAKVKQNNILSKRSKSDVTSKIPSSDLSLRTYLSDMCLSLTALSDLLGSRLVYEKLSKQTNKHGDLSLCYTEKLCFDNYHDDYIYYDHQHRSKQINSIRHKQDVIYREVNRDLIVFLKEHKIPQSKVLGRLGLQCTNHVVHYLGIIYIHKGCITYISNKNQVNDLPEIKQLLTLHGIVTLNPIFCSRITVNWKQLLGINVIPQSSKGNVSYDYKDTYPYRLIE
jgi:hypothetical protein